MSHFNPSIRRTARKTYRCYWCGQPICTGDTYDRQTGVYDGQWFDSKMHTECTEACAEDGDEYLAFSNPRPPVVTSTAAANKAP